MSDTPLRVAIWAAVSSKAQAADDKYSLGYQQRQGCEFAEAANGQVAAVYVVPGHTRDIIFYHDAETAMDAYAARRQGQVGAVIGK